jgi:hypothetical protein
VATVLKLDQPEKWRRKLDRYRKSSDIINPHLDLFARNLTNLGRAQDSFACVFTPRRARYR